MKIFNDTVPAGILVLSLEDGKVVFSNQFFRDTLGGDGDQVLGASWEDFFVNPDERQELMVKFAVEDEVRNFELRLRRTDGGVVWGLASLSSIPIKDEELLLFAFVDITPLKEAEEEIRNLANHDPLTALPTRRLFSDNLNRALARASRSKTEVALLFVDLDGFKAVNDTLGHDVGDGVLTQSAKRLLECVRETDTVARLGGDEFVIILERQDVSRAQTVGERVVNNLSKPFVFQEGTATIGASVGIAFYPQNGRTENELINAADKAMYEVKKATKGAVGLA
ncbi:MAG: sensor domain-containing diguanylate cyclase [Rhodospirillales bacterium]|nr:sensor domain-containing diguanylate cyclase [Rhodospirillales bacterium]